MKLFVFSDIHADLGLMQKLVIKVNKEHIDAVLFAGDVSIIGHGTEKMLKEMRKIQAPVFLIHGNHDSEEEMRKLCKENLKFMHGKIVSWMDYVIVGWGGGGFSSVDRQFERFVRLNKKVLAGKKIVLITHGPPFKTALDTFGDYYVGNKSYTDFIKQYSVVLAVSGHIHETAGKMDKIKKTMVVNPGPLGMIIEL